MTLPALRTRRPATAASWDPFREIEDTWSRLGSLLGDVVGPEAVSVGPLAVAAAPIDIEETDDAYIIELELPGVRREDVSIDLSGNELQVTGEIKERERKGTLRRQTRKVGSFEHRIVLPEEVDPDSVDARLADGVLTIRLGKSRQRQPRRIEVTSGASGAGPGGTGGEAGR
ncbi:Hsp20/alpha crystallin family protein [Frankia sp. QA3]|uniref:Hsp20/alpha crystallin family protein n=1 Tax=Frankia sp. QA3 TaxID=710111 RepID=UPI000269C145|nr:Hsp20/alpha crystallin family protein [Frankia sp. QA3]EIV91621.1 molecular chaperone (small heat shock protein) [Frankia sp. QA3]